MNQSSTKHYIRGGQVTFHNIRMFIQVNKVIVKVLGMFFLLCVAGYLMLWAEPHQLLAGIYYYVGWFLYWLLGVSPVIHLSYPYHGHWISETQWTLVSLPFFKEAANYLWLMLLKALVLAGALNLFFFFLAVRWFTKRGAKQNSRKFIRGSRLVDVKVLKKQIIQEKKASHLKIDGLPMIKNHEVQHTLIHGTTGTGKTQVLRKRLRHIRARGEKAIIYDKGGTLTSTYFREGDIILNPFDLRCAPWDLWEEAQTAAHVENMAESLIPMHGHQADPFWVDAARTIFSSTVHKMRHDADRSIEKLTQLLLTMELKQLENYVKNTESATLTSDKIEKTAISIRSVLTTYLKSMRFLFGVRQSAEKGFSLRDWILDDNQRGWIFISTNGENLKALRPLISMWMAMASLTILSLSPNESRRIYVECDEVTTLHRLPLLPEILAEARKFGGCFCLGMQSFALLKAIYGYESATGIFDLLNTRFFFRNPSHLMSKFVSEELREMEVDDPQENYSYGANSIRDGISMSHQRVTRPVALPSEIAELENLECFVQVPGRFPVTKMNLIYEKDAIIAPDFMPRVVPENAVIEEAIICAPKLQEDDEKSTEKAAEKEIEATKRQEAELSKQRREAQSNELAYDI